MSGNHASTGGNSSTAARSSMTALQLDALPTEARCSYRSKVCENHRAVKQNGDLHKLCDFHRLKANINQQRLQLKRRTIRQQLEEKKNKFLLSTGKWSVDVVAAEAQLLEPCQEPCGMLTDEELRVLQALLFEPNTLS